jgi:flagellar assembly protein FliH
MPWSKAVLPKALAQTRVLEFVPKKFELGTPDQAIEYLAAKQRGGDFHLSDALRVQTGIDEIEKARAEEQIELRALELLKDIQEPAYKEAYELGLHEGRQEAFNKFSAEITEKLGTLEDLLKALETAKAEILNCNETHMMTLVYQLATKLARVEVEKNDQALVEVLRGAVSLAQDEENITVHVAPGQHEFVEELKKSTGRQFEFLKKIKFEASPDVANGGCIVETNYGEVDARIEQRIASLWAAMSEQMPRVKPKVAV